MDFSKKITDLAAEAEIALTQRFAEIDKISFINTERIMRFYLHGSKGNSASHQLSRLVLVC